LPLRIYKGAAASSDGVVYYCGGFYGAEADENVSNNCYIYKGA